VSTDLTECRLLRGIEISAEPDGLSPQASPAERGRRLSLPGWTLHFPHAKHGGRHTLLHVPSLPETGGAYHVPLLLDGLEVFDKDEEIPTHHFLAD
jgi:hypothetical protein